MNSALQVEFIEDRRAEFFCVGYTVLGGFANLNFWPELIREAVGMRERYPGIEASELWELISSTLPCEEALKRKGSRTVWNAIFNCTAPHIEEKDWNKGVAR